MGLILKDMQYLLFNRQELFDHKNLSYLLLQHVYSYSLTVNLLFNGRSLQLEETQLNEQFDNFKLTNISARTRTSIQMRIRCHSVVQALFRNTHKSRERTIVIPPHATKHPRNRIL